MKRIEILKSGKFALSDPARQPLQLIAGEITVKDNQDADLLIECTWAKLAQDQNYQRRCYVARKINLLCYFPDNKKQRILIPSITKKTFIKLAKTLGVDRDHFVIPFRCPKGCDPNYYVLEEECRAQVEPCFTDSELFKIVCTTEKEDVKKIEKTK